MLLATYVCIAIVSINVPLKVVRMVETYDTTTIRASTPMFLMARKIKAMGVKMVLSGEGADEVFFSSLRAQRVFCRALLY